MKYMYIGVGGTGAKIANALTYLIASGFLKEHVNGNDVYILLIDMDTGGGVVKHAGNALDMLKLSQNGTLPTPRIGIGNGGVRIWSPDGLTDTTTLKTLFDDGNLDDKSKKLLNSLFSGGESHYRNPAVHYDQDITFKVGARGQPRPGAVAWAHEYKKNSAYMSDLIRYINPGAESMKIMFGGSLIGGTGASAIPTVISSIYSEEIVNEATGARTSPNKTNIDNKSWVIGMTMLQKYFDLPKKTTTQADPVLGIDSDDFHDNSRIAMMYYEDFLKENQPMVDSVYLVGVPSSQVKMMKDYEEGGTRQINFPLPAEITAAASVMDFFKKTVDAERHEPKILYHSGFYKTPNEQENDPAIPGTLWMTFPYAVELKRTISQLAWFSSIWADVCWDYIDTNGKKAGRLTVFDKFGRVEGMFGDINNRNNNVNYKKAAGLYSFCNGFLSWLKELEGEGDFLIDAGPNKYNIERRRNSLEEGGLRDISPYKKIANKILRSAEDYNDKDINKSDDFENVIARLWEACTGHPNR